MKINMKVFAFAGALATLAILAGCTSVRPLSSTPPSPVITLTAAATVRGIFSKATFPAGDYKATLEDHGGYYYQAPGKIVANDILVWMYDGGLYVKRGSEVPERYYLIKDNGQTTIGRFGTLPTYELKR
jgi:hypothetical protein